MLNITILYLNSIVAHFEKSIFNFQSERVRNMYNPRLDLLMNFSQMREFSGLQGSDSNSVNQMAACPPRRKRLPSTYTSISNDCREELVKRVTENKEKIIEVFLAFFGHLLSDIIC